MQRLCATILLLPTHNIVNHNEHVVAKTLCPKCYNHFNSIKDIVIDIKLLTLGDAGVEQYVYSELLYKRIVPHKSKFTL